MRRFPLVFMPMLLVALPALAERGNGQRVSESRNVSGFTRIQLSAPMNIVVRPGKFAVTLNTDSNVAPLVRTDVQGDTLHISLEAHHLELQGKHLIQISMPEFRGVHIQGSGDADISGFKQSGQVQLRIAGSGDVTYAGTSEGLEVKVEGSGNVTLPEGTAGALHVSIDGSGDLRAASFRAKNASVSVNGSGNADLQVSGGAVQLAVNGSGDIRWSGDASAVSSVTHGSGSIRKR
jgi:Putative auto-transporter adhesin, head GIN domain